MLWPRPLTPLDRAELSPIPNENLAFLLNGYLMGESERAYAVEDIIVQELHLRGFGMQNWSPNAR